MATRIIGQILNSGTKLGFSRLKGIFRSGINYSQYEQIISTAKNTRIGNIPKDLLNLIIKRYQSNKGDVIKLVQDAFDSTSCVLQKSEKFQIQAINRFSPTIENAFKYFTKCDNFFYDNIYTEKMNKLLFSAEGNILKELQRVIPDLKQVKISYPKFGSYSQAFKCEFLNESGEKIISDKMLKTFREQDRFNLFLFNKIDSVVNKFSAEEIQVYAKSKGINLNLNDIQNKQLQIRENLKGLRETPQETLNWASSIHGAGAEANMSEYLRFFNGHKILPKEGLVIPDMVKLGDNSYQISEFVSKEIKASKEFSFERLCLEHSDLSNNNSGNVCFDIGGIHGRPSLDRILALKRAGDINNYRGAMSSVIVGDKYLTKQLKRFLSLSLEERLPFLEQLEREANSTKDMIKQRKLKEFVAEVKDKYRYDLKPHKLVPEEECISESEISEEVLKFL